MLRFTRWTAICGCVFELESDPDSPIEAERNNRFALANYICPKHEHLKSNKLKADHSNRSKHVMEVLELAKQNNVNNSNQHIARFKKGTKQHTEAINTHSAVLRFNDDIHNEWTELTSNIHAYDEHIYDIVLKENQITTE